MRIVAGIIVAVLLILGISPGLFGLTYEDHFRNQLANCNAQGDISIKLIDYHRHYYTSDAKIQIQLLNPGVIDLLKKMGVQVKGLQFVIAEHVQHGPVFYFKNKNLPSRWGWVAIHNKLIASSGNLTSLRVSGLLNLLESSDDRVSFLGNYYKHIKTDYIKLSLPQYDFSSHLKKGLDANIWFYPSRQRWRGDIALVDMIAVKDQLKLLSPKVHLAFDQRMTSSGIWLGSLNIDLSAFSINQGSQQLMALSELNFNGLLNETQQGIVFDRKLKIKEIQFDSMTWGPIKLHINASHLNTVAISNLISAYRRISEQGELYRNQLQKNIVLLLPAVFSPEGRIKLQNFYVGSKDGRMLISGYMTWPSHLSTPSDLSDLISDSEAKGEIRISKLMTQKIINYLSQFAFFRDITRKQRDQLIASDQLTRFAKQRNILFLSQLVDKRLLPENFAMALVDLQGNDASLDVYASFVRNLYLNKDISLMMSYMILWQYIDVRQHVLSFMQSVNTISYLAANQLQDQFDEWLKDKIFIEKNHDYVMSILQEKGMLKINGREV